MEDLKRIIRGILVSSPFQLEIWMLNKDYEEIINEQIPYRTYGFKTLEELLHSIPDVVEVQGTGKNAKLRVIVSNKIAHIDKLISKQKVNKCKTNIKSRRRFIREKRSMKSLRKSSEGVPVRGAGGATDFEYGNKYSSGNGHERLTQLYKEVPGKYRGKSRGNANTTKVFVRGLPAAAIAKDLLLLFAPYGKIVECDIVNRRGFLHLGDKYLAMKAIKELNKVNFMGARISVEKGRVKPLRRRYRSYSHRDNYERGCDGSNFENGDRATLPGYGSDYMYDGLSENARRSYKGKDFQYGDRAALHEYDSVYDSLGDRRPMYDIDSCRSYSPSNGHESFGEYDDRTPYPDHRRIYDDRRTHPGGGKSVIDSYGDKEPLLVDQGSLKKSIAATDEPGWEYGKRIEDYDSHEMAEGGYNRLDDDRYITSPEVGSACSSEASGSSYRSKEAGYGPESYYNSQSSRGGLERDTSDKYGNRCGGGGYFSSNTFKPRLSRRDEKMPSYKNHQLLGDGQLLRFSEQILKCATTTSGRLGYCISGQKIKRLLQRVKADEYKLSNQLILLIGTNDFIYHTDLVPMCDNFIALLNVLKQKAEHIVVLTVPPVPKLTNQGFNHTKKLKQFNQFLMKQADEEQVFVVDLASSYIGYSNTILKQYYEEFLIEKSAKPKPDLVHLNHTGLKLLKAVLDIQYFDKYY